MNRRFYKKITDIIVASAGLLISLPFYPFIALAIKLESRGPVIVKLDRISQGKIIKVYKFRSMVKDAQKIKPDLANFNERKDGSFFKIKNDPRITRMGKLLRKFRLDEFPQLFNVMKGELSMVGPRPHEPGEVSGYPPEFRHIILAKAGVTGLSQVNGASSLPFLKELTLDDYYLKNQSFLLDLKIIVKTLLILFFDPTAV
ncbi:MAG: sugar transferase [Candidatus Paceibacterota bacterium]